MSSRQNNGGCMFEAGVINMIQGGGEPNQLITQLLQEEQGGTSFMSHLTILLSYTYSI